MQLFTFTWDEVQSHEPAECSAAISSKGAQQCKQVALCVPRSLPCQALPAAAFQAYIGVQQRGS